MSARPRDVTGVSTDWAGYPRLVLVAGQVATTTFTITVPPGGRWLFVCGSATYVASSAAGGRNPSFILKSGGLVIAKVVSSVTINPSTTTLLSYLPGGQYTQNAQNELTIPCPTPFILDSRFTLGNDGDGTGAGDTWENPIALLQQLDWD